VRPAALLVLVAAAACGGPSGAEPDAGAPADGAIGCEAADPRTPATAVFVGPAGLEARLAGYIDGATDSLDVMMYLFTVDALADRVIAARQRGVDVRVLLDPDHEGNPDVRDRLAGAGVPVRDAPARFEFAHAKYLLVDGTLAVVTSANFNYGAMDAERNYGAEVRDPDDVADLAAVFDADWAGAADPDLACTRLIVSPVNARSRVLALITGSQETLDLSVIYLSDSSVRTAVIQAHDRGVVVRVVLADPADFPENATTAETLRNQGVEVRFLRTISLHAKLVLADGVGFVGSQNLSSTSLSDNREVGVLVTESAPVATLQAQLDADWLVATP
jgi:phosphatidylserine/phosphatidylglycerophosphate/cardiolipin synthase-like enzyme